MTDNIAISVDDLRKKYKRGIIRRQVVDALQGVSFDVNRAND
jgi:ABC-type oligopeptide transport system ATPase subunit